VGRARTPRAWFCSSSHRGGSLQPRLIRTREGGVTTSRRRRGQGGLALPLPFPPPRAPPQRPTAAGCRCRSGCSALAIGCQRMRGEGGERKCGHALQTECILSTTEKNNHRPVLQMWIARTPSEQGFRERTWTSRCVHPTCRNFHHHQQNDLCQHRSHQLKLYIVFSCPFIDHVITADRLHFNDFLLNTQRSHPPTPLSLTVQLDQLELVAAGSFF